MTLNSKWAGSRSLRNTASVPMCSVSESILAMPTTTRTELSQGTTKTVSHHYNLVGLGVLRPDTLHSHEDVVRRPPLRTGEPAVDADLARYVREVIVPQPAHNKLSVDLEQSNQRLRLTAGCKDSCSP